MLGYTGWIADRELTPLARGAGRMLIRRDNASSRALYATSAARMRVTLFVLFIVLAATIAASGFARANDLTG